MQTELKKDEWKNCSLPYLFVLKEGPEFEKNFLDYSLCIMQIRAETLNVAPSSKMVVTAKNKYDTRIGS